MTSQVHGLRRAVRARLAAGDQLLGTFVKLATTDVVELAVAAGYDLLVVDLEHSTLTSADAVSLVRHADVCGIAALVRIPAVDPALINRLLENGAAGIQLSMLRDRQQVIELLAATRFAPHGRRSISTANRVASGLAVADLLAREDAAPPLLVGQLETALDAPAAELVAGLDVCFVGPTDLAVDLGIEPWTAPGSAALRDAVADLERAAETSGVAFGGWAANTAAAAEAGFADAGYLLVGSDLQLLGAAFRDATRKGP